MERMKTVYNRVGESLHMRNFKIKIVKIKFSDKSQYYCNWTVMSPLSCLAQ